MDDQVKDTAEGVDSENDTMPGPDQDMICPKCGSKLVLRTAKKGEMLETSFMDVVLFRSADTFRMLNCRVVFD